MGKLSGLHESLAMIAKGPMPQIQAADDFKDTALLDALNALVTAVNGITIPEVKIDLNAAIGKLVKAINGITFPESKPIDMTQLIEAIKGVSMEVEIPEHKPMEPCAYTFKVVRDSSGILTSIIATPGLVEEPEHTDTASYE